MPFVDQAVPGGAGAQQINSNSSGSCPAARTC